MCVKIHYFIDKFIQDFKVLDLKDVSVLMKVRSTALHAMFRKNKHLISYFLPCLAGEELVKHHVF